MSKRKTTDAVEPEPPTTEAPIPPSHPTLNPPAHQEVCQEPSTLPQQSQPPQPNPAAGGTLSQSQRRNLTVITQTDGNVPFYSSVKELMDVGALLVISREQLRTILTQCLLPPGVQAIGTKMELLQSLTLLHYVLSRRLGFLTSLYIVLENSLDELDESRFFKIGNGLVSICELEVEFEVYHFDHALIVTKIDFDQLKGEARSFEIQPRRNASFGQGGQNVYKCDTPLWWTENRNKFYFNVMVEDNMRELIRPRGDGDPRILAALVQISEGYPRAPDDIFSNKRPKKVRGMADFYRVTCFHQANIMRTVPNARMIERGTQTTPTPPLHVCLERGNEPPLADDAAIPEPTFEELLPSVNEPNAQNVVPASVTTPNAQPEKDVHDSSGGDHVSGPLKAFADGPGQLPSIKVLHATARVPKSAVNGPPQQVAERPQLTQMIGDPMFAAAPVLGDDGKPNLGQCAQLGHTFGMMMFRAMGGDPAAVTSLQSMGSEQFTELVRGSPQPKAVDAAATAPWAPEMLPTEMLPSVPTAQEGGAGPAEPAGPAPTHVLNSSVPVVVDPPRHVGVTQDTRQQTDEGVEGDPVAIMQRMMGLQQQQLALQQSLLLGAGLKRRRVEEIVGGTGLGAAALQTVGSAVTRPVSTANGN